MNKNQSLPWDHPRFRSWIAVARACQLMQQSLGRALAHLDIKPPHLDILVNLFRFEGISQQELARKLLVGRSNMSMLLPQMEKRGLIERRGDKHDKRILRLYLTGEGRRLTEEAMAIQTDLIDRTLSDAPLAECEIMTAHMERIVSLLLQDEREPLDGDQ
ncbi:MarR family winged helix-turn-helix transcriptional regulator [Rhizobium leucaenae]|uniref:DNA-binding MarR family transcriptional regulator n=1 Tax=Rhizobium leucaenae TaxID=29450 RepID=A0A7W6ZWZ5_9HYPH|nr:MarR family winged helix-turn-helix transcriptional regulator [Rhizobium leucaenae]MBB4569772.1 DNA-binding MarR family transcriptional regulator [Rhizobium leucaenae]MBB6299715.1 DNA-binding MarR family transcriptional regulator [Rhizobium leucaenae]